MRITWIGAAGLIIEHEGATLLIDPYITRPGKLQIALCKLRPDIQRIERFVAGLSNVQGMLVGHTHLDHALDIPDLLERIDCKAVGGASLRNLLRAAGLPDERMFSITGGETLELGPFSVRPLVSRHGKAVLNRVPIPGEIDERFKLPAHFTAYKHGEVWSFMVSAGGRTLFHQGSADLVERSLEGCSADAVFCCVPGWKRRPELPQILLERLDPQIVVPFHFDDFSGFKLEGPIPYDQVRRVPGMDPEELISRFRELRPEIEFRRIGIMQPWDWGMEQ
ncbi:MAG: MBL fold metallo-hydrolase [Candidatus Alcyoniella australis]|nr:MBL fold metallo-hydrolase [Candidatus Alcyoniella australis]